MTLKQLKKIRSLLAVVAVILLVGGGVSGYFDYSETQGVSVTSSEESSAEESSAEESSVEESTSEPTATPTTEPTAEPTEELTAEPTADPATESAEESESDTVTVTVYVYVYDPDGTPAKNVAVYIQEEDLKNKEEPEYHYTDENGEYVFEDIQKDTQYYVNANIDLPEGQKTENGEEIRFFKENYNPLSNYKFTEDVIIEFNPGNPVVTSYDETDEPSQIFAETFNVSEETTDVSQQSAVPEETDDTSSEKSTPANEDAESDSDTDISTETTESSEESTAESSEESSDITEEDSQSDGFSLSSISVLTYVLLAGGLICALASVIMSIIISKKSKVESKSVNIKKPANIQATAPTVSGLKPKTAIPQTQGASSQPIQQKFTYAQFNKIGRRPKQEDCCGVLPMNNGTLAIVADGMGGLKDGGKISELVVRSMMELGQSQQGTPENGVLLQMLYATNEKVNRALGPDIYKSGSTMLAVWVQESGKCFQWAAVGDSRMYLYRGGRMIQLNQEHNYGQELLKKAVKGEITFDEARNARNKGELTSFIGMGQLKYVDYSVRPLDIQLGDRILLMSDGVYNAVSAQQMEYVLQQNPDVQTAADNLVKLVEQFNNPKQDNYTAIILGF